MIRFSRKGIASLEVLATDPAGVEVWAVQNVSVAIAQELCSIISKEEEARANRFQREADRVAYIITRGTLRVLLGERLERSPHDLKILVGTYGKPYLGDPVARGLDFNVTHTAGYSYLAFSKIGPVGIDLEKVNRAVEPEMLAGRFFHPSESAWLNTLNCTELTHGFFRLWVRKEAFAKALGFGLGLDLSLHSLIGPVGQDIFVGNQMSPNSEFRIWRVCDLNSIFGYYAALVVGI